MSRTIASHVALQTTAQSVPAIPAWFGEVVLIIEYLRKHEVLTKRSRARAFCAAALRALRRNRLSRRPVWLCDQRGTHPGDVLRAAPALRRPVHGLVWP